MTLCVTSLNTHLTPRLFPQGAHVGRPIVPLDGSVCLLGVQVPEQTRQEQSGRALPGQQPHHWGSTYNSHQSRACMRGEQNVLLIGAI